MTSLSFGFPWLPTGHAIGDDFAIGRVVDAVEINGQQIFQLVKSQSGGSHCLLFDMEHCSSALLSAIERLQTASFTNISWGKSTYCASVFIAQNTPYRLKDLRLRSSLIQYIEARALADALSKIVQASWSQSVYLPSDSEFIPLDKAESKQERLLLVSKMLTGNVAKKQMSPERIHAINKWITADEVSSIFQTLGLADLEPQPKKPVGPPSKFKLPGQPELERFFREEIIEYFHKITEYQNMGTKGPGGVLLYGKPGSGKTYAVRHLAKHLEWPMIELSIGRVGSPYIHQTSKELRNQFDKARQQAPCIIFMDEIDALGGNRDLFNAGAHKIEEITELLNLVEEARKSGVIVVAATNRPDAVDPALKRTGRFDNQIEVKFPDFDAMVELLENCLASRPHKAGINFHDVAKVLSGKAASDAELIVNEAAKIAVRLKKGEIDEECLSQAIKARYGVENVLMSGRSREHQN